MKTEYTTGDVLVLFGEVFQKGYANGLIQEATKRGMKIIYSTVGRREKDGSLRPLTSDERAHIPEPFINIPLEAGFDLEKSISGLTPCEQLKDIKLTEWQSAALDLNSIQDSLQIGRERFQNSVTRYMLELKKHIPPGKNILFAHLMAGGVPRSKIILSLMNKTLKGTHDRFIDSKSFWQSDIGKLCELSFEEVTAETFRCLIESSKEIAQTIKTQGGTVSYAAYGYHGTTVLIGNEYQWQSYSPYLQGWAKLKLETLANEYFQKGILACVYNCPEILTNSSSIFQGVELPLYSLIRALNKENSPHSNRIEQLAIKLLGSKEKLEKLLELTDSYLQSRSHDMKTWPEHNNQVDAERMLEISEQCFNLHLNPKELITFPLSEIVFESCGKFMIQDAIHPAAACQWINHDAVARLSN